MNKQELSTMQPFIPKEIILRRPSSNGLGGGGQMLVRLTFDTQGRIVACETHYSPGEMDLEIHK
jgi:hypothetical protein